MQEFHLPSNDKHNNLHVVLWDDVENPKGLIQISHGMIEYVKRFDAFAKYLNRHDYIVIGNDHLGHGETASCDEDLGYFCDKNMSKTVVDDLHSVTKYVKDAYPNLPLFLFGHSMGSFMARRYLSTYSYELSGVIISGTGYQPPVVLLSGKLLANLIKIFKGDRHRSRLLNKISFSGYNKRIPNARTNNDWLTRDTDIVNAYRKDKFCTYYFTVNGYRTLFEVISYIQKKSNIKKIPKKLPVLFISGMEDPVGAYGKGVKKVYRSYLKNGMKHVKIRLYQDDRHELTNELNKQTVFKELNHWLNHYVDKLNEK